MEEDQDVALQERSMLIKVNDSGLTFLEGLSDLVKSARCQVGTISHGGGDPRSLLAGPADLAERTGRLLSRPGPATLIACGVVALACLVNFLRGAMCLRRKQARAGRQRLLLFRLLGAGRGGVRRKAV